jgi:DNA repair protein RecO (recombination protein O)
MAPPRLYKTEAIVLRQRRLGEADRILTLYTPIYGKIEAKARGVRRTTSRLSGHLQPLNRCMVQLARGRATDVIAGCETLESFQRLRNDLERLSRALYAAELTDRMMPERVQSFLTYRLLLETLRRLEGAGDSDLPLRHFEMRLLDQTGFRPQLDVCAACGGRLPEAANYFDPLAGGVLCATCAPGTDARSMSLNAIKVLRLLQRGTYKDIARLKMPAELAQEVERHLRSYLAATLERDIRSAAFIERLRREAVAQRLGV